MISFKELIRATLCSELMFCGETISLHALKYDKTVNNLCKQVKYTPFSIMDLSGLNPGPGCYKPCDPPVNLRSLGHELSLQKSATVCSCVCISANRISTMCVIYLFTGLCITYQFGNKL